MNDGIELTQSAEQYTLNYGNRGAGIEFTTTGDCLSSLFQQLAEHLAEEGL